MISNINERFVFPRIPLRFSLPEGYPNVGRILNVSVEPEITEYRIRQGELEIKGSYQVTISYFEALSEEEQGPPELRELEEDDFFCHLRLETDGLFTDEDDGNSKTGNITSELYTVHFLRPIHTIVDTQFIGRPRYYRPGIAVERAEVTGDGRREIKGELVLSLANRGRRRSR